MTNLITSASGKKEATIIYTIAGSYRATLIQIVNTGIGIEKDFLQCKEFSTRDKAVKWATEKIN